MDVMYSCCCVVVVRLMLCGCRVVVVRGLSF